MWLTLGWRLSAFIHHINHHPWAVKRKNADGALSVSFSCLISPLTSAVKLDTFKYCGKKRAQELESNEKYWHSQCSAGFYKLKFLFFFIFSYSILDFSMFKWILQLSCSALKPEKSLSKWEHERGCINCVQWVCVFQFLLLSIARWVDLCVKHVNTEKACCSLPASFPLQTTQTPKWASVLSISVTQDWSQVLT